MPVLWALSDFRHGPLAESDGSASPSQQHMYVKSQLSHIIMMLPRRGNIMLVRYFRRLSRIEQLRSSTGGHLLEGFAKELS